MIDKTKYFDCSIPDLTNGIYIYYFCDGTKAGEVVGNHEYIIGNKTFYIRKVSIYEIIATSNGWIPAIAYDGKDFNDVDLRYSENVLVEYPFRHLMYFEPMKRCYFLSLKEAESTAEYLMELERKKKNEKGNQVSQ